MSYAVRCVWFCMSNSCPQQGWNLGWKLYKNNLWKVCLSIHSSHNTTVILLPQVVKVDPSQYCQRPINLYEVPHFVIMKYRSFCVKFFSLEKCL